MPTTSGGRYRAYWPAVDRSRILLELDDQERERKHSIHSAIASLEYPVALLDVPLIVVLAHDACGAVRAALDLDAPDAKTLPPHIAGLVAGIRPAVRASEPRDAETVGITHLRRTVTELVARSELISDAVAEGRLAVVGANYKLLEGLVDPSIVIGDVGTDF